MEWINAESSHIDEVAHDSNTNTLFVKFRKTDDIWKYTPVTKEVYRELLAADSKGSFFAKNIKFNKSIEARKA